MPNYLFENPNTGEIKEVYFRINEKKFFIDDRGIEWKRIFTAPQTSINTKVNPFDLKKATENTRNKKGTVGDLFNYSKELSEKRKEKAGKDSIKEKYYDSWKKLRRGKEHPSVKKENLKKDLNKLGVGIEL